MSTVRCFGDVKDPNNSKQLKKKLHKRSTFPKKEKRTQNCHFPRPQETDPFANSNQIIADRTGPEVTPFQQSFLQEFFSLSRSFLELAFLLIYAFSCPESVIIPAIALLGAFIYTAIAISFYIGVMQIKSKLFWLRFIFIMFSCFFNLYLYY